jgi:hypothetical protein
MVEMFRWSPIIKSYRKRNVMSAAILNEQTQVVAYLSKFYYKGKTPTEDTLLRKAFISTRDEDGNTFLHFMYRVNIPEITTIIRQAGYLNVGDEDEALLMNLRGMLPERERHALKQTLSDEEEDTRRAS